MIHKTAIISDKASIGNNVSIGPYSIIHDDVVIGDNTEIGSHCELGVKTVNHPNKPLIIGEQSLIRSHSVFYSASTFGNNLVTGHRVNVREQTTAGNNFQIGTLTDIQGYCKIGNYVRTHSNVHIGQMSIVRDYVWLFPYIVLTNDPHPPSEIRKGVIVDEFSIISTMSVILPGVTIKKGTLVGAHSNVTSDTEEDSVVVGNPAKIVCYTNEIRMKDGSGVPAYPWRKHFHRGYPEDIVKTWVDEFNGQNGT